MATATTTTTTLAAMKAPMAPVKRLMPSEAFPYHPSRLETLFFTIPPEIRHQIYEYVFYTPNKAFQKTIKGWRDTPEISDLRHLQNVNGTQLLAINRKIRSEALPVLHRTMQWKLDDFNMLRYFLNKATLADCAHLHIRKISLVSWKNVLQNWRQQRWVDVEQGSFIASTLADLPSLRELELSPQSLPSNKEDYVAEEWFNLMSTLASNSGVLRVVAAECEKGDWFNDWRLVGGRNFSWCERVMLRTHYEVRDWNELVEADLGNFDFSSIFLQAMAVNWQTGPLKHTTIDHACGRKFVVKFWGVPENVRRSEERRLARKEAKKAYAEQRKLELGRKAKTSPKMADLVLSDSEEDGDCGDFGMRRRKEVTREDARTKRMDRQRGIR